MVPSLEVGSVSEAGLFFDGRPFLGCGFWKRLCSAPCCLDEGSCLVGVSCLDGVSCLEGVSCLDGVTRLGEAP